MRIRHPDARRLRPCPPDHRKIALVLLHDLGQNVGRQAEKALLEAAQDRGRLLHQVGDLVQQGRLIGRDAAHAGRGRGDLLPNHLLALRPVHHDAVGSHGVEVIGRPGDDDIGRVEGAQAAADAPTTRVRIAEGHHLLAEQRHEPANRPAESCAVGGPAHGLLETDAGDQLDQQLGQKLSRGFAGRLLDGKDVAPAVGLAQLQAFHGDPAATRKADRGLRPLAGVVLRPVGRRPAEDQLLVCLPAGQLLHMHHQPPRRARRPHCAVGQTRLVQQLRRGRLQLSNGRHHVVHRQLLAADLQHQIRLRAVALAVAGLRPSHVRPAPALAGLRPSHALAVAGLLQERILHPHPLLGVQVRHQPRQIAHAAKVVGALGDADRAARVQQVEGLRATQDVVVGRDDQAGGDGALALRLVQVVHLLEALHIGQLEVVLAILDLLLQVDVAVAALAVPGDLPDLAHPLQEHGDALQPVGQLDADRLQSHAAGLLEIGELGDLHAVQPNFPAQAPSAQRGAGPVVLDEADVMLAAIDADRVQAAQIEFLRVAGVGLEDDLVLGVHLHAVGVLAVAAIVGAEAGLGVGHVPRLWPQDAQHSGRVHGAGADLLAVGLPDDAAALGPVALQTHDDLLKGGGTVFGHGYTSEKLKSRPRGRPAIVTGAPSGCCSDSECRRKDRPRQ